MRRVYDNGLKFSSVVARNIDKAMERVFELNKASLIIIDGGVGEGKTTLAEHIARYATSVYNEKYSSGRLACYKREEQLAMGGGDFMNKLQKYALTKPVMLYDESGDFTSKRALTNFNFRLNRIFETYRATKILVVLSLPTFLVLDNALFYNKIPRLLLHLEKRTKNQGRIKGYSLWRMFYIKHKSKKLVNPLEAYNYVECNFWANFLDNDPEEAKKLNDYTLRGKAKIHKQIYAEQSGLMTTKDLARELQVSVGYIRILIHKKQIKEEMKVGNVKYYKPDIIAKLKK